MSKDDENRKVLEDKQQVLYSKAELFREYNEIFKNAPPVFPLWGNIFFRKTITSIVGDPGVCKTSMGYGMASQLCNNRPFLDIVPEEPIRCVFCDWESSDSLIASRGRIVASEPVPNLYVFNIIELYLQSIAAQLVEFCKEKDINLIILDNQTTAFPTRDENDNSEAAKQMKLLRIIVNTTNAALLIYHHTSKANMKGTRAGTGAYARARLADICIKLDIPDEDNKDIVRFEMAKNRIVDDSTLWFIKKSGGTFTITEPPMGLAGQPTSTLVYQAQQEIKTLLGSMGGRLKRDIIIAELSKNGAGFNENTIILALQRLKQIGSIQSKQYGFYEITNFT